MFCGGGGGNWGGSTSFGETGRFKNIFYKRKKERRQESSIGMEIFFLTLGGKNNKPIHTALVSCRVLSMIFHCISKQLFLEPIEWVVSPWLFEEKAKYFFFTDEQLRSHRRERKTTASVANLGLKYRNKSTLRFNYKNGLCLRHEIRHPTRPPFPDMQNPHLIQSQP